MNSDHLKTSAEKYAHLVPRGDDDHERSFLAGAELMRAEISKRDAVIKVMREALNRLDQWYYDESPTFEHECTHSEENEKIINIASETLATVKRMEGE